MFLPIGFWYFSHFSCVIYFPVFFHLAHLALQNVNKDYVKFSYFSNVIAKSDQKPKTKNVMNKTKNNKLYFYLALLFWFWIWRNQRFVLKKSLKSNYANLCKKIFRMINHRTRPNVHIKLKPAIKKAYILSQLSFLTYSRNPGQSSYRWGHRSRNEMSKYLWSTWNLSN